MHEEDGGAVARLLDPELRTVDLNVGQGPLGFTFACGSASLLADAMTGKAPPFAMDGLTLRP